MKSAVREVEPGWVLVVEIGERAFRKLLGFFVALRNYARILDRANAVLVRVVKIARPRAINRSGKLKNLFRRPFRRIQPVTPQIIKRTGCFGNLLNMFGGRLRKWKCLE